MGIYSNQYQVQKLNTEYNMVEIKPSRMLDSFERFYLIQSFRAVNKNVLYFDYSNKIYVVEGSFESALNSANELTLPDSLHGLSFSVSDKLTIELFNPERQNQALYFLAEILATHLRKSGYLVEGGSQGVFRASLIKDKVSYYAGIELWPGFDYQFLIDYKEKTIFAIFDPRYRLTPSLNSNPDDLEILKGKAIKDICLQLTCEDRTSPFRRCTLSGRGKTMYFDSLLNESPIRKSKEFEDVRESLNEVRCPTGILKAEIEENEFSILASYDKKKSYKFPIERIAQIPLIGSVTEKIEEMVEKDRSMPQRRKFQEIKNQKTNFMRKIQPNPVNRFIETETIYDNNSTITLEAIPIINLLNTNRNLNFDEVQQQTLKTSPLYSRSIKSLSAKTILRREPFDIPSDMIIYFNSELSQEFTKELFKQLNNLIRSIKVEMSFENVDLEEITSLKEGSVVLYILKDESSHDTYYKSEFDNLQDGVYSEKITFSHLSEVEKNRENHLYNVILGLICKSGGTPWIVDSKKEERIEYSIGWKVSYYNRRGLSQKVRFVILSIYDTNGILKDILVFTSTLRDYETKVYQNFEIILSNLIKEQEERVEIQVHRDGGYFPSQDYKIIEKINSKFTKTKIKYLAFYDGLIRLYSLRGIESSDYKAVRVNSGTYKKIMQNYYVMVTYDIKSRNDIIHQQELKTAQTISIEFINNSEEKDELEVLQSVYDLTRAYHGYIFYRIKHPVTIHSTRKVLNFFEKHLPHLNTGYHFQTDREFFV